MQQNFLWQCARGGAFYLCLVAVSAAFAETMSTEVAPIDFNRDIRPILSDKCFYCHGPDDEHREADLRLDTAEGLATDLGGYHALVAGKPGESAIIERVTEADADLRMPPEDSGKELKPEEIELLRRWIAEGGKWSAHWAYVSPQEEPMPEVGDSDWASHWIDQLVLAQLETKNLSPSPEADRITLIRRVTFDLTGLPPTLTEVEAFVGDNSANAYEKVIDRLIASDRFGERMAMWWFDLVRFADTVGYHGDQPHRSWPYRDYVINAFNSNKPFDTFTIEQLSGDLLPKPTQEQLVATCYNRLLQTTHEGGLQVKEYRAIYMADRVRNVSQVWMGATMGCCQCHNHKYDPFTAKDFYAMGAFFGDIDDENHLNRVEVKKLDKMPTLRSPEMRVLSAELQHKVVAIEDRIAVLEKKTDQPKQLKDLNKQREKLNKSAPLVMFTKALKKPRKVRYLPRGNWLDETGEIMQPAIPKFLGAIDVGDRRASRLDLARWLTTRMDEGGVGEMTARVQVNRFWYLMLGSGISRVLDDFGGQGEPPVHPELLDRLGNEFFNSGWDVKHMMKLIAMSNTYRQSSLSPAKSQEADPENRLYSHQSRPRISAEMVRDTSLSISGLLVNKLGGPSVKPYQPNGYYRHMNFPKRTYSQDNNSQQWRRGLYVHWQRQFLHPMMKAFDAPSREECTAQRPQSNTPVAALTLLNDPTFVEAARAFAERMIVDGGEVIESRIETAFRLAVSRKPDAAESQLLAALYDSNLKHYRANPKDAKKLLGIGLSKASKEIDPVELAATMSVARAVLNMSETITRN